MRWDVTTGPTVEPLSLAEAKRQIRVDHDHDNQDISDAIVDARDFCENYLDLAILSQTITLKMDKFPSRDYFELPRTNLLSVTSIKYFDDDSVEQTLSTDVYGVETAGRPGIVYLKAGKEWPTALADQRSAVEVIYKAGYGETRASVPGGIKRAMKLLVGHWDSNREASIVGTSISELPLGVAAALDKHKVYGL